MRFAPFRLGAARGGRRQRLHRGGGWLARFEGFYLRVVGAGLRSVDEVVTKAVGEMGVLGLGGLKVGKASRVGLTLESYFPLASIGRSTANN